MFGPDLTVSRSPASRYDRRMTSVRAALAVAGGVCLLAASAQTQDRFPTGRGKAELLKVCSGCHEPDNVFAFPKTVPEWAKTLDDMAQRGTEATPAEWQAIELYLDKFVALIPINRATSEELVRTMDVTEDIGAAIATYREQHGAFKSTADLKRVPGLDAEKVDARRDRLVF